MLQFDELRLSLEELRPQIEDLREAIGVDTIEKEVKELEKTAAKPGFWDDVNESKKILRKTSILKNKVESYNKL